MTQKMALGGALPKPILCNNPYFLVSTDRYGLRQRRLYYSIPHGMVWFHVWYDSMVWFYSYGMVWCCLWYGIISPLWICKIRKILAVLQIGRVVERTGWHIAHMFLKHLLACSLIGQSQWHLFLLLSLIAYIEDRILIEIRIATSKQ